MSEACIPFGYVRGISSVSLMLMVKIESYAIGSAFERGQARGRRLFARSQLDLHRSILWWSKVYLAFHTARIRSTARRRCSSS